MGTPGFQNIGSSPGTYALILSNQTRSTTQVGRLGELTLAPGTYLYIGSAFGPGGIASRCQHHAHSPARPHWHIDYLRPVLELHEIWFSHDPERREHQWAALLAKIHNAQQPFPGFGASDCSCHSHLFFFPTPLSFTAFCRRALPGQAPIQREILATG
jgi:Uri superfamily endonuclease